MKQKNNHYSIIEALNDPDFSTDFGSDSFIDNSISFPPIHSAVARYVQPGRLFGADFRSDTLVGFRSTDTVDYSLLGQNTSITANLAKGKVDKVFGGAAIDLNGMQGRYIRIYQPLVVVNIDQVNQDFFKLDAVKTDSSDVIPDGITRAYGYDEVIRTPGGYEPPDRVLKRYVDLDLGRSCNLSLIVLQALADTTAAGNTLRIYVSNQPLIKSTTAYATLAADPTVRRIDVNVGASTTFTDTLSLIRSLVGTSQGDRLTGDGNANTLSGGGGDDTLAGGAGADSLNGDNGNDVIVQDLTLFPDMIAGGGGIDTVDYSSGGVWGSVVANLASGRVVKRMNGNTAVDTLSGIENLIGTSLNDSITGDLGSNILTGGDGNDTLTGGGGTDSLLGGEGDDVFMQDTSPFGDVINGGNGADAVDYSSIGAAGNIVANLAAGTVARRLGSSTYIDMVSSIEVVVGTALADNITGNSSINKLYGGAGDDILNSGGGGDVLSGGPGSDTVIGGDSQDYFVQDIGRDSDTLVGGAGNNTVDYGVTPLTGIASTGITANLATGKVSKVLAGTSAKVGATGRYIRIYHTDATQLLTLTGLKVFSAGLDLAAGKPSTVGADVGSIGGTSYNNPWALTDSAVGGAWNGGTRPSTSNLANVTGNKPYIELDLGSLQMIDSIALWGHTNVPANSNNLRVYVSSNAFVSSTTAYAELAANASVARVDLATVDVTPTSTYIDTLSGISNLLGTALNDNITGDGNANLLHGAAGNDTLAGGAGSDIYRFYRGDGADVVQENDSTPGNQDILSLGWGIDESQVWLSKVNAGKDLRISIIGTGDSVTVSNWYAGSASHIEKIYTGSKELLDTNVDKLVSAMAAFTPPAAGQTSLPANLRTALQPVIAANWTTRW